MYEAYADLCARTHTCVHYEIYTRERKCDIFYYLCLKIVQ